MVNYLSAHGIDYAVCSKDAYFVGTLDDQRKHKKAIYGSGFLLSDKAAADKVAAKEAAEKETEKATEKVLAAQRWQFSDRELEIIRGLG